MAFSFQKLLPARFRSDVTLVPVIRLSGAIGSAAPLRGSGLNLAGVEKPLARAFSVKSAPVVAIVINSPGGAAVQSHLIHRRIRALAEEKQKRVLVFIEDVGASGGYMIAAAGDEIIVDPSSIVGSIGVVSAGFGFQEALGKLGVERRVYTAGSAKARLDPFRPEQPEDVARLKAMQEEVHAAFIALVKARRPGLADDPELFTGAFWAGIRAVELGLADGVGDVFSVLRERFGPTLRIVDIPTERNTLRRRLGLGTSADSAAGMVDGVVSALETRSLWSRYGL